MNRITFYLLIFALLFTFPSYSNYSTDKIPGDFIPMLEAPASVTNTKNFATFIARQFITKEETNLDFFLHPKAWQAKWNQKYQALTKTTSRIKGQDIFLTLGTMLRGLLNSDNEDYLPLANKIAEGMLNVLMGDLGFRTSPLAAAEKKDTIREVLNLGRWLKNDLAEKVRFLGLVYGYLEKQQHKIHFQKFVLYLLAGNDSEIKEGAWYLTGVSDKSAAIQKAKKHANDLLPRDESLDEGSPFDPNSTPITALTYNGRPQLIYGTPGIQTSDLHAALGRAYARYPQNMVLGSLGTPRQSPTDTFSIFIKLDPTHYFVIMRAPNMDNIFLLPSYMKVKSLKEGEEKSGTITANILSSQGGVSLASNMIEWRVNEEENISGGHLSFDSPKVNRDRTFSFTVSVKQGFSKKEIKYYYWHPLMGQMQQLKTFANKPFTLQGLYLKLESLSGALTVSPEIRAEIEALKEGRLANFSPQLVKKS
ncbi:MAG: hypothetical protein K2Q34_02520 [Alphaproteobacteria bacterium]|nr:hypothetical protein [Alphaproteobacteria bacterium]